MKKIIMTLLMSAALAMTLVSTDVLAKRMANGGNMGMQRSATPAPSAPSANKNTPTQSNATSTTSNAAGAAAKSSWMGPLMGFAAGGLLAAMLMGGGFDGIGGMDILLLVLIAAAAFMFFRRRAANQQTAAAGHQGHYDSRQSYETSPTQSAAPISIGSLVKDHTPVTPITHQSIAAPSWFNAETFLPQAKTWYVKLQAAWDNNDRHLLAALTTPELFTQLSAQLDVATEENHTQVEEIHAEIVEFSQEDGQTVLTLRYTGYVSETIGAFSHAIHEYWHLVRVGGETGEWKLAGIQQAQ
jgi:predicted lipid-binding transport protein (Tim44 family)